MATALQYPALTHGWPCAMLRTTSTKFEVAVETPGFAPDELSTEIEGHTLLVCGRPESGREDAAFAFAFNVPADTDLDQLHARFDDGVLTVTAPIVQRNGKRSVEIERPHLVNPLASGG